MNFPIKPRQFFDWLSKDGDGFMNHMLSEAIDKKGQNINTTKKLLDSLNDINNEDDLGDYLENTYPKVYDKNFTGNSQKQKQKLSVVYNNFKLIKEKLNESFSRPKEFLDLKSIITSINIKKGDITELVEDLSEMLAKKQTGSDYSKRKHLIRQMKKDAGLDNRKTLVLLTEKLKTHFQNEKKPTIEDYLKIDVPNFNFMLVRLKIDYPKNAIHNLKWARTLDWDETKEGKSIVLSKIMRYDEASTMVGQIDISRVKKIKFKGAKQPEPSELKTNIMTEYDYPILYELLIKTDYVMNNAVRFKIVDRTDRQLKLVIDEKDTPEVKETTTIGISQIDSYLKILLAGKNKQSTKTTVGGKVKESRFSTNATKSLLFSVFNNKQQTTTKHLFDTRGSTYRIIPIYGEILSQGTLEKPIEKALESIKHDIKIDRNTYLKHYLKKETDKYSKNEKSGKKKILEASIKDKDSIDYAEFQQTYEGLNKNSSSRKREELKLASGKIFNKDFINMLIKEKYFKDEDEEKVKAGLVEMGVGFLVEDSSIIDLINEQYENKETMAEFSDWLGEGNGTTASLNFKAQEDTGSIPDRYTNRLEQAICYTIMGLPKGTSLQQSLNTNQGTDDYKRKPLSFPNAIYLTNFLAKKYGQTTTAAEVQQIDTEIAKGLNLESDSTAQAVEAFASSLNKGAVKFNTEFAKMLKNKLEDIANNSKDYFGLYNSEVLDDLIKLKLLVEV
tara:strand:+ start:322 stop:2505 length:2184 start_codon:yes stop_codon:yes gene_type:complete